MKFRVATFNIQHGRDHNLPGDVVDISLAARHAAEIGADVVGFNEVRRGVRSGMPGYPDTPAVLGGAIRGEYVFGKAVAFGRGKHYGNAIVSKFPIVEREVVPIPGKRRLFSREYREPRCIVRALIDVGGTRVTVLSTHFGLSAPEHEAAADTAICIAKMAGTPVILMGDLNITPDDPVFAKLSSVFCDAASALGAEEYTFPSDHPEKRIDYILLKGCSALEIHTVKKIVSDHLALTAEIELS